MKIAVTATEGSLDAAMDPRFGRCPYFVIVETDDLSFEAVENSNAMLGGGAGVQSAQLIAGKGVTSILTGNRVNRADQHTAAASVAQFGIYQHLFADADDRAVLAYLAAFTAMNAPGVVNLGNQIADWFALGDFRFQKNVAIGFLDVAVEIGYTLTVTRSHISQVCRHGRLTRTTLAACNCNFHL